MWRADVLYLSGPKYWRYAPNQWLAFRIREIAAIYGHPYFRLMWIRSDRAVESLDGVASNVGDRRMMLFVRRFPVEDVVKIVQDRERNVGFLKSDGSVWLYQE